MPTKHAAIKSLRQNIKARNRNQTVKLAIKKMAVRLRKTYTAKQYDQATELTSQLVRAYDRAAQKRVVTRNTAARHKSRLIKRLRAAKK